MLPILVISILFECTRGEYVETDIPTGRLLGLKTKTIPKENVYYSFRGIRYAETPGRFQPSVAKLPWDGIYNATEDQPMCVQAGFNEEMASEDCLFINVYTPRLPEGNSSSLPVMFWVHGGAFIQGGSQSSKYAPDYFIDDGVILVSINYRLGIFGFLSTGDGRVPGNNGLKDIILGLQWVQANIRYFSGDPTKVTIFGESAGAVMVSHLTVSPLTWNKGYFVRAICQSGNVLSPWALQRYPEKNYQQVLSKSTCRFLEPIGLELFCLREISTKAVTNIETAIIGINAVVGINILNGITFSPSYEIKTQDAVLTEGSYSLLENGHLPTVPVIMGINSEEGIFLQGALPIIRPLFLQADIFKDILVPEDMYASDEDKKERIVPAIRDYYFNEHLIIASSDNKIIRFISDAMFNKPFRRYLSLVGNRMPQYCYQFTYVGNPSENHQVQSNIERVGHADELSYMWRDYDNITLSQKDLSVKDKMVRLWTNFAKYGNPSPVYDELLDGVNWGQAVIDGTDVNCLKVDEQLEMMKNPKETGYKMWYNLYESYGHPNDTY